MKNGKYANPAKRRTRKKSPMVPIVLAAGIVLLVMVVFLISQAVAKASRMDPFDYISVSFTGYEGNGELEVDFAKPDLIEEILMEDPENDAEWFIQYDVYDRGIQLECTPEEGLSNGDKVTVAVTVSDKAKKYVKAGEKIFPVSGLPEIQMIDIFEDITFSVEGMSGEAWAKVQVPQDNELLRSCNFKIDPQINLRNGDTVMVTLQNAKVLEEKYLVMPKESTKAFTVSGLDEYLTDSDLLPEDAIRDIIPRHLEACTKEDHSGFTYTKPQYYKTYFFTAQEGSFLTDENILEIYVCYNEYLDGEYRRTICCPIKFQDLILHPDGTIDLAYENGSSATFCTDPDTIPDRDGYDVEEVYIEYET